MATTLLSAAASAEAEVVVTAASPTSAPVVVVDVVASCVVVVEVVVEEDEVKVADVLVVVVLVTAVDLADVGPSDCVDKSVVCCVTFSVVVEEEEEEDVLAGVDAADAVETSVVEGVGAVVVDVRSVDVTSDSVKLTRVDGAVVPIERVEGGVGEADVALPRVTVIRESVGIEKDVWKCGFLPISTCISQ